MGNEASKNNTLQSGMNPIVEPIANDKPVSLNLLKEANDQLLAMNQAAVKEFLACKQDILEEHDLYELVDEYFKSSLNIMLLFNALEKCLLRALGSTLPVLTALRQFDEETEKDSRIAATLADALKNFRAAGNPFTKDFFDVFRSVYYQQKDLLEKLQRRKKKLTKKQKNIKTWKNVLNVIYDCLFFTLSMLSGIAAALAPPLEAVVGYATATVNDMIKRIDSILERYEAPLRGKRSVINSTHNATFVAIADLENIMVRIDALEVKMQSSMWNDGFVIDNDVAKEAIKEMDEFKTNVEELRSQANTYRAEITKARDEVLEKINTLSPS